MDVTTGSLAVLSEKLERYDERDDLFRRKPNCRFLFPPLGLGGQKSDNLVCARFFNSHPSGKEQNAHRITSEDFTFLIGGPQMTQIPSADEPS